MIHQYCGNNDAERVLTQEILLHLGHLIHTRPELFTNMITLRIWYFVQLLVGHISRKKSISLADSYNELLTFAPHEIYQELRLILESFTTEVAHLTAIENLKVKGLQTKENFNVNEWALYREEKGMISGVSTKFYKNVWYILKQCRGLVIGDKYNTTNRISNEVTLESTPGELSFNLLVEKLLQGIEASDYRQLNIEAIDTISGILKQRPDLYVDDDLILDVIIGYAVRLHWLKKHPNRDYNEQRSLAWKKFYKLSPSEVDRAFVEAFIYLLKEKEV
jgi:phosphorylase kinase alpha/beta subunit